MKNIIAFALAALLALGLASCGGTGNPGEKTTQPIGPINTAQNFSYTYRGVEINLGAAPESVLAALPEPTHTREDESCAIIGAVDSINSYPGLELYVTYPEAGEAPFITSIRFMDDSISTPEGLYVGDPRAQIEALHGKPDEGDISNAADDFFYYYKGESSLQISVGADGTVDQIIYDYLFLDEQ